MKGLVNSKQYLIIKALYLLKQRNIYKYFWLESLKKKAWTQLYVPFHVCQQNLLARVEWHAPTAH